MLGRIHSLLFINTSAKQTIAKNFFWLSAGEIASRLIRALFVIYAARILGTEGYGIFSYALGLAGFFTLFSNVGISQVTLRNMTQNPKQKYEYFATSFVLQLALLVLTTTLIIFVAPAVSRIDVAHSLFMLVAAFIALDSVRNFLGVVFQFQEHMQFEALSSGVTNIIITAIGILFLVALPTPSFLVLGYAIGAGVGTLVSAVFLRRWLFRIVSFFRLSLIRPILATASSLFLLAAIGPLTLYTDTLMLGWWTSESEIGIYSASQRIVFLLIMFPTTLSVAVFPFLSRLVKEGNTEMLRRLMERVISYTYALAIPLIVGGVVLAKSLLDFVYNPDFAAGAPIFQLLLFTLVFIFPAHLIQSLVFAFDRMKQITLFAALGAFSNVLFNILLIPHYGALGSVIATLIALFFHRGFLWREARALIPFRVLPLVPRVLLASLLGPGILNYALLLAGMPVLWIILISGIFYALTLFLLRDPVAKDFLELIRKALSSRASA